MFKLSKRWLNAPLRADLSEISGKTRIGLGVVFAVGALCASLHGAAAAGPVVDTKEGPVQGFIKGGVAEFLGIPYATPPLGDLRWRPPTDHAPWTTVLKATAYALSARKATSSGCSRAPRTPTKTAFI